MTDKIGDIEERISRFLQDGLDELYLLRQEETVQLDDVRERGRQLTVELRELAAALDQAAKDYERSREELRVSSRVGLAEEQASYERASEFMKIRGSLEERHRLLSLQRNELQQEERRLEHLVKRSEKTANRLRMVLSLFIAPEEFVETVMETQNSEALSAAFHLAEREAVTFARELHDGPCQTFSALGLTLEMGREYLHRGESSMALEEIDRALEQTKSGLDEIRALLFCLSPTGIQEGFELPLRRLAVQVRQNWGSELSFTLSGNMDELPVHVRIGAFKTLHQAVTNAAGHGATEVRVSINYAKHNLRVRITDNGKGFNVEQEKEAAKERGSYGLVNMEERMKMLGGKLSISSVLNKGSSVSFSVPIIAG
ncbi:MAG: histidine kinase [Synergistaceae bacterium]|jgi:two-component system sensor histidine kinase DegS|nr:histidine kinase [Synergistaceae bacterium]